MKRQSYDQARAPAVPIGTLERFQVVDEQADYLHCNRYNGSAGAGVVKVAKPAALRGSVTGVYAAGDQIVAARECRGGVGVVGCSRIDLNVNGRGSNAPIEADQWCNISQDAPTTVDNKPATLQGNSTGNNAYEGASASLKALIHFKTPLAKNQLYLVMPWTAVSPGVNISMSGGNTFTGTTANLFNPTAGGTVTFRTRAILADYDISALTWNGFIATPPTMDADVVQSPVFSFTWSPSSTSALATWTLAWGGLLPGLGLKSSVDKIYGVVMDIKINPSHSQFATYTQGVLNAAFSGDVPIQTALKHIYAVKVAA